MTNINDLESRMRAVMADAREEVPEGVWENVSARIPRRERRRWYGYAVPAFAFACIAALLLMVRPDSVPEMQEPAVRLLTAEPAALQLACLEEPAAIGHVVRRPEIPAPAPSAPEQEEAPAVVVETPCEEAAPENCGQLWEEILAEEEPAARSRVTVISASGVLGGNDSRLYGTSIRPSYAAGAQAGTLTENSVSAYGIPVSAGLGIAFAITDRLSVGTGVNWTLLSRTFQGSYKTAEGEITHKMHYVGIPLNLYFRMLEWKSLSVYAFGGAQAEKCISNKYYIYSQSPDVLYESTVDPLSWSVSLGAGVNYSILPKVMLYFEPGARYYIPCGQPKSLRTDKPLNVNLEAGVRFAL